MTLVDLSNRVVINLPKTIHINKILQKQKVESNVMSTHVQEFTAKNTVGPCDLVLVTNYIRIYKHRSQDHSVVIKNEEM